MLSFTSEIASFSHELSILSLLIWTISSQVNISGSISIGDRLRFGIVL